MKWQNFTEIVSFQVSADPASESGLPRDDCRFEPEHAEHVAGLCTIENSRMPANKKRLAPRARTFFITETSFTLLAHMKPERVAITIHFVLEGKLNKDSSPDHCTALQTLPLPLALCNTPTLHCLTLLSSVLQALSLHHSAWLVSYATFCWDLREYHHMCWNS